MFGHTAHTVIFKYSSYFNNMCDEHVPKVSSPTSPPLPPIQVHHPNRVLPNLIKVSSPTAPPLPPIQGHHPNRILPNLMTQEDRIKASKREKKNRYRKLYRLRQNRKRAEKIRFVARRRARRREEKQKLKDEEQKLNARRIEEEQKKVIQLNKNEISKNAETETSNNSSLPAANECDSETSFNVTSTQSDQREEKQKLKDEEQKLNARRREEEQKKVILFDRKCGELLLHHKVLAEKSLKPLPCVESDP